MGAVMMQINNRIGSSNLSPFAVVVCLAQIICRTSHKLNPSESMAKHHIPVMAWRISIENLGTLLFTVNQKEYVPNSDFPLFRTPFGVVSRKRCWRSQIDVECRRTYHKAPKTHVSGNTPRVDCLEVTDSIHNAVREAHYLARRKITRENRALRVKIHQN